MWSSDESSDVYESVQSQWRGLCLNTLDSPGRDDEDIVVHVLAGVLGGSEEW